VKARLAPAARARCTGSTRTLVKGSVSFQRSSGCWRCADPNTPVAPARAASSRRRRG
jgi:hypothetical protein